VDTTRTITRALTGAANKVVCPNCGETVIRSGTLLLDAECTAGGLYQVDRGFRQRRPLRHLSIEHRTHKTVHGGGHDVHECPPAEHWTDR
jgi:hypothetical protein